MEPAGAAQRLKPMSPFSSSAASPAPTPDHPAHARLHTDSIALRTFADAHRDNGALLGDGPGHEPTDLVDLAVTFGLIGAELLAAVAEFLQAHRSTTDAIAARHRQIATTTRSADAAYVDCDCAAADRELTL